MSSSMVLLYHIGVEGGFQSDEKRFEFEEKTSIVVLPQWYEIPFPGAQIPDQVSDIIFIV